MQFHESLIVFCLVFPPCFFFFIPGCNHSWRDCLKAEIAPNKAELDIVRRESFPKTETWNCVRLLVESGRFGAVIWRAARRANEGKHVSF